MLKVSRYSIVILNLSNFYNWINKIYKYKGLRYVSGIRLMRMDLIKMLWLKFSCCNCNWKRKRMKKERNRIRGKCKKIKCWNAWIKYWRGNWNRIKWNLLKNQSRIKIKLVKILHKLEVERICK